MVAFPLLVTVVDLALISFVLVSLAYLNTDSAVTYDEQMSSADALLESVTASVSTFDSGVQALIEDHLNASAHPHNATEWLRSALDSLQFTKPQLQMIQARHVTVM